MQELPHCLLLVALPPGQLLEGRAGQVSSSLGCVGQSGWMSKPTCNFLDFFTGNRDLEGEAALPVTRL